MIIFQKKTVNQYDRNVLNIDWDSVKTKLWIVAIK